MLNFWHDRQRQIIDDLKQTFVIISHLVLNEQKREIIKARKINKLSSHIANIKTTIAMLMRMYSITLPILALLASGFSSINCKYINETTNISTLTYDNIHEFALRDQVDGVNCFKPFKSLKTRPTLSLDGLWDFCFDNHNKGFEEKWESQNLKSNCHPGNFYRMPVPSAFNEITSNKTAKNYVGWIWYQRRISNEEMNLNRFDRVPRNEDKFNNNEDVRSNNDASSIFLQFEGVNYMSIVWLTPLDGKNQSHLLGTHVGGYLPFAFDLTKLGKNSDAPFPKGYLLTVVVSNRLNSDTIPSGSMKNLTDVVGYPFEKFQPDFDFFHFAGIMGQVNLIRVPGTFIEDLYFDSRANTGEKVVQLRLNPRSNHQNKTFQLYLEVEVDSVGIKWIPLDSSPLTREMRYKIVTSFSILVSELPDSNHPENLGILKVSLYSVISRQNLELLDVFEVKFSNKNNRLNYSSHADISLNEGKRNNYHLKGFGMHHEQMFSGRTMSLPAIMKDMYLVKQVGANVIRTSHYPYSSEYLDACDEMGILVIAECHAVGLNSFSGTKLMLHKQLLKEMMERDHLHPSIVMWSIANEPMSKMPEARVYFASLVNYTKNELADYTTKADRPITAAIAQSHDVDTIGNLLDVIMVNRYYGWYDYNGVIEAIAPSLRRSLGGWAQKHPGKPLILSEFGADTLAGLHQTTSGIYSEEYQSELLVRYEETLDELAKKPVKVNGTDVKVNLWGSMIWNFADFSTHESVMRVGGNKKGIFTQNREPKLAVSKVSEIYHRHLDMNNHNDEFDGDNIGLKYEWDRTPGTQVSPEDSAH